MVNGLRGSEYIDKLVKVIFYLLFCIIWQSRRGQIARMFTCIGETLSPEYLHIRGR